MNSEMVVFLDTSIQIERIIGNKTRQAQIEQELKNPAHQFVTSSYVFMEFQRSLWADFVYVYNLMQQHTDWQTIAYRLRSGRDLTVHARLATVCKFSPGLWWKVTLTTSGRSILSSCR